MFENRALRRIFGPKRGEVARECRKLHNEVLNGLYSSPNKIEKKEMGCACSLYVEEERRIRSSGGETWRQLGRPSHGREINIKMGLRMSSGLDMGWALVNTAFNHRFSENEGGGGWGFLTN